jgi:hypothetical protein
MDETLLEKLIDPQPFKKFPVLDGTSYFNTAFKTPYTEPDQSSPDPIPLLKGPN